MAVIKSGASSDQLSIDATSKAARITPYDASGNYIHAAKAIPISLGAFSLFQFSGLLAAGAQANTELYQFRWRDATRLCVLRRIGLSMGTPTAYGAGQLTLTATVARGFTAVGSGTGSSAAVMSTNNTNKKKTSHGYSLVNDADAVILGTAVLSAGTKTLDTNPFAGITMNAVTTPANLLLTNFPLWDRHSSGSYPFVFAQNEGFVLRITCPATGTAYFGVQTEWEEMTTAEL